jgi:hypothetical protein
MVEAVFEVYEGMIGPQGGAELLAAHHFAPALQKQQQDPERLFL